MDGVYVASPRHEGTYSEEDFCEADSFSGMFGSEQDTTSSDVNENPIGHSGGAAPLSSIAIS